MAIINCPECGHNVSELAPTCPNCGVVIAGNIVRCPECGTVYLASKKLCPSCHCPSTVQAPQTANGPQQPASVVIPQPAAGASSSQPQATEGGAAPKKKSPLPFFIILVLLIAGVVAGAYFWNQKEGENEEQYYEYAMSCNDPVVLQQYLDKYRDASPEHRDSIQARLSKIQEADTDWTNAVVAGTKQAIEDYLKAHADSPHKAEALNRIDSIDYCVAMKSKTMESYQTYLKQHPDGTYAEEIKNLLNEVLATTVLPEETKLVKDTFLKFFQAVNSRNADKMIALVTDQLTSFLGRSSAEKTDVLDFLNKIYKADITNMNWHILNDYKINKREVGEDEYEYEVTFSAEQNIERTDASQPKYQKYSIKAVVNSEGRISEMNMKKINQ